MQRDLIVVFSAQCHRWPSTSYQVRDALQFVVRQPRAFAAEQRGDGVLGGAVEERLDEVAQRRLARGIARHGGRVDVAQPLFLVADVPFSSSTRSCVRTVE